MSSARAGKELSPLGIVVFLVVLAVVARLLLGSAAESAESLATAASPATAAPRRPSQSRVVHSASDVCKRFEEAGNREPGFSQRCAVDSAQGERSYRLTVNGDYGDDEGLIIVLLLHELAKLDEAAASEVSQVKVVRPDPQAAFRGSTTVQMSALRNCYRNSDRLCTLRLIARPD